MTPGEKSRKHHDDLMEKMGNTIEANDEWRRRQGYSVPTSATLCSHCGVAEGNDDTRCESCGVKK